MNKPNFIKKLKLPDKHFQFFIVAVFSFLIFIPFLVFAINTVDTGWRSLKNNGFNTQPVYWNTSNDYSRITTSTGACIINNSSNDYFVPARTSGEWSNFISKMNSLLMTLTNGAGLPNNSCMNGTCVAPAETCNNNPVECGNCGLI